MISELRAHGIFPGLFASETNDPVRCFEMGVVGSMSSLFMVGGSI